MKSSSKGKEKETEAETEASKKKSAVKTTENTTTSSTEKTVKAAQNDSSQSSGTAALAGYGSETEKESGNDVKSITVTSTTPVQRVTALVSGGSSSGSNRASVTNIDTGTTVGTYHNSGSSLSTSAGSSVTIGAGTSSGDADSSGGLVDVAGNDEQSWSGTSGGYTGDEIEIVSQPEPEPEPAPSPTYRTIVSACNIRSYPDYGDNVIGGLGGGETVLFYGEEAGWYKIEYNGIVGYIGPRFLQ